MEIAFATILRMRRLAIFVAFPIGGWSGANAQWDIEESHRTASLRGIHNISAGIAWAVYCGFVTGLRVPCSGACDGPA
jgi:hypothetical protein